MPCLFLFRLPCRNKSISISCFQYIIEAKCTDDVLFISAAIFGAVVLILQTFPIFMNNWVFLTEPRPINKTNENGEQIESTFHYNVGYFQVCRTYKSNESGIVYNDYEITSTLLKNMLYVPFQVCIIIALAAQITIALLHVTSVPRQPEVFRKIVAACTIRVQGMGAKIRIWMEPIQPIIFTSVAID
ncbi:unnamed protein product [Haemonchus placei]|uniref:G protein-coupled receptor n=1 Tax=Haemonchus placei TaxID=6290 RepID=A0A0N4WTZ5_HAEPC|nr:unnamed protein product [Haemonchus placei]